MLKQENYQAHSAKNLVHHTILQNFGKTSTPQVISVIDNRHRGTDIINLASYNMDSSWNLVKHLNLSQQNYILLEAAHVNS